MHFLPIWNGRNIAVWAAVFHEFRSMVPGGVMLAICVTPLVDDNVEFALLVLLIFDALPRRPEARGLNWGDISIFALREQKLYHPVFKTRRMIGHGLTQHVRITCPHNAAWVHRQKRTRCALSLVWPHRTSQHSTFSARSCNTSASNIHILRLLACAEVVPYTGGLPRMTFRQ